MHLILSGGCRTVLIPNIKIVLSVFIMITIQTLIVDTTGYIPQERRRVALEVVLSNAVNTMPYLIIYQRSSYSDEPDLTLSYTVHPFAGTGNSFFFEMMDQTEPKYFSLVINKGGTMHYLMRNYHFEPGDDITVKVDNRDGDIQADLSFSGVGVAKYRCQAAFNHSILFDEVQVMPQFTAGYDYNCDNRSTRNIWLVLQVLKKYEMQLSAYSYELLKVDIIAGEGSRLIANFKQKMENALANDDTYAYLRLSYAYTSKLKLDFDIQISTPIQYNSREYSYFLVEKFVFDYLKKYIRMNYVKVYHLIYKSAAAGLRDKMLMILLIRYKFEMKGNYNTLLKHAVAHVKNKECLEKLLKLSL